VGNGLHSAVGATDAPNCRFYPPAGQDPMSLLVAAEGGGGQPAAAPRTPRPMPLPDFRFLGCASVLSWACHLQACWFVASKSAATADLGSHGVPLPCPLAFGWALCLRHSTVAARLLRYYIPVEGCCIAQLICMACSPPCLHNRSCSEQQLQANLAAATDPSYRVRDPFVAAFVSLCVGECSCVTCLLACSLWLHATA